MGMEPEEIRQRDARLNETFDELQAFVCEHGPKLMTRGMPALEANEALLECLKQLKRDRDVLVGRCRQHLTDSQCAVILQMDLPEG